MRIRTIKPEFYLHEELFRLESNTELPLRVAFSGLWCAADREGRFKWKPMRLKAQIMPYDELDFETILNALLSGSFIVKYSFKGEYYGFIPSFKSHQRINQHEAKSELPDPNSEDAHACTCLHIHARGEGKGKEGNKEGNRKEVPPVVPQGDCSGLEGQGSQKENLSKAWTPTPLQMRFNALYSRRATTAWTDKEKRALAALGAINDEDMLLVESFYRMSIPPSEDYRRRDLLTLLNNFMGEVDRARNYRPKNGHRAPESGLLQENLIAKEIII